MSGEKGRQRVEQNEARRERKKELNHDALAQGEEQAAAAPAEGEQGEQSGDSSSNSRFHRFVKFDESEEREEREEGDEAEAMEQRSSIPVSYTHLTLPTILLV